MGGGGVWEDFELVTFASWGVAPSRYKKVLVITKKNRRKQKKVLTQSIAASISKIIDNIRTQKYIFPK